MSRHWLPASVLIGAALVAGTAACSGPSPTAIAAPTTTTTAPVAVQVKDVVTAMKNASAVHVKGTISSSGSKVALDVQINKDGTASGTIAEGGPAYPIILVNKIVYIQFTPDVMSSSGVDASSAAGQALANKWVPSTSKLMASSDMASSVEPLLDYTQFITQMTQNIPSGPMKVGKSDTVDGTAVVAYKLSDGTPIDVAVSSPHYLMRLVPGPADGGASAGQLDFTNWNRPVAVQAPPASEIYSG